MPSALSCLPWWVGLAGGIIRDLLIGIPPQTFRDWRYLAVAAGADVVCSLAHPVLARLERPILIFDAAGLALFCVTGASAALDSRMGAVEAIVLGAITGIGGGMLRDILLGENPGVLRTGLYAIPALIGTAIVVAATKSGTTVWRFRSSPPPSAFSSVSPVSAST